MNGRSQRIHGFCLHDHGAVQLFRNAQISANIKLTGSQGAMILGAILCVMDMEMV